MDMEYRVWSAIATVLYVMAFIVWTRLAHAVRNKGSVHGAVCIMPMIVATAIESVSCGWIAFSHNSTAMGAEKFGLLISPFMAIGSLVIGVYGLVKLQCPDGVCTRSKTRYFFSELMKSVPD